MRFRIDFQALFGKATDMFFGVGLTRPEAFHGTIRPVLNGHSGGDLHKAQALAIEGLHKHLHVVRRFAPRFREAYNARIRYDTLRTRVAGRDVLPVGAASGMDPDAEALEPLSLLFGFLMPGPVLEKPRDMGRVPFVDDSGNDNLYVAPGFSSKGVAYSAERLREYRESGGDAVILPAVLGIPSGGPAGCREAARQLTTILRLLEPMVDGFVWCPYWADDRSLLTEAEFLRAAEVFGEAAGEKLKLVEMFAYEEEERETWFRLAGSFLSGGGDGLVAVTGRKVSAGEVPGSPDWGFESAVLCGKGLARYRQRAIEEARKEFPRAFLVACGGIHGRDAAFDACEHANVIAENEAYTRYGPGLAPVLLNKLVLRLNFLHRQGARSNRLRDHQEDRWAALRGQG